MKHTKGPWYLRPVNHCDIVNGENLIVSCDTPSLDASECLANARLISAAPEMLEALLNMQAWLWSKGFSKEVVNNAIKKARG